MVRIQSITFDPDFCWEIEQSAEELAADFALDADPYLDETLECAFAANGADNGQCLCPVCCAADAGMIPDYYNDRSEARERYLEICAHVDCQDVETMRELFRYHSLTELEDAAFFRLGKI